MHIFIDESGTFAFPPDGEVSPSIVGALIVPDCAIAQLFKKYERLRGRLPKENGEVKGRLLKEHHVDEVVTWLRRNQCIFEAMVIEMGRESRADIAERKLKTGSALTDNLTDAHNADLKTRVFELRAQVEAMSEPLYIQASVTFELLARIIHEQPSYWIQRQPKELLNYRWMVDGKAVQGVTPAEKWWDTTKGAFLQSMLGREPMMMIEGYDLTRFEAKFRMPMPQYLRESLFPDREYGYDLKLLLDEHFSFSAAPEYGLELVDVLTNATRRALKGHLGASGWRQIPQLMIARHESSLTMISLSKAASAADIPYRDVVTEAFRRGGRNMVA
jgi:hypothetical protein